MVGKNIVSVGKELCNISKMLVIWGQFVVFFYVDNVHYEIMHSAYPLHFVVVS